MEQSIYDLFDRCLNENLAHIVISSSSKRELIHKVTIRPLMLKNSLCYQIAEYKNNQVFHKNLDREDVLLLLPEWFEGLFRQAVLLTNDLETTLLVSKKGKVTIINNKNKKHTSERKTVLSHDRKKEYIISEDCKIPFLIDLGVMSKEGKIIKSKYDKFRQINRFLEFIEDVIEVFPKEKELHILDFGCGKSYLTFAMYYYLKEMQGYSVKITGLDLKKDVVEHCNELKDRYGYDGLEFLCGDIASYHETNQIDMVVTLHACDTATDYALYKAVEWGASVILSVPCCQHEINQQMKNQVMSPFMKHGLIKERMSALMTDAVRAECLELKGYKVQVMEFIDMEHTPKNILIRAVKSSAIMPASLINTRKNELLGILDDFSVSQSLVKLLGIE